MPGAELCQKQGGGSVLFQESQCSLRNGVPAGRNLKKFAISSGEPPITWVATLLAEHRNRDATLVVVTACKRWQASVPHVRVHDVPNGGSTYQVGLSACLAQKGEHDEPFRI